MSHGILAIDPFLRYFVVSTQLQSSSFFTDMNRLVCWSRFPWHSVIRIFFLFPPRSCSVYPFFLSSPFSGNLVPDVISSKAKVLVHHKVAASVPNPTFLLLESDLLSFSRGDSLGHDPKVVCPQETTHLVGLLSLQIQYNSISSPSPSLFHVCQNLHGHFQP